MQYAVHCLKDPVSRKANPFYCAKRKYPELMTRNLTCMMPGYITHVIILIKIL